MRDAPPNPAPPTVPPATARGFSRKTCPGQARVWPASRRRRVSQGVTPTPQPVTCPGCSQPGHEVPAPRPSGAAVDLPLTRARLGCSETAVSEWFEERGVTASFNSGGMTTAGRPARTRSRVRRSCREGASRPPPARLARLARLAPTLCSALRPTALQSTPAPSRLPRARFLAGWGGGAGVGGPSSHLILCQLLLLLPSVFPSIRVFSNESALCICWSKYWSSGFSTSPSNEYSILISFRMDWLDLAGQGTLKSLLQHHSSKPSIL